MNKYGTVFSYEYIEEQVLDENDSTGQTLINTGKMITVETLSRKSLTEDAIAYYKDGEVDYILLSSGKKLTDVIWNHEGNFEEAVYTTDAGEKLIFNKDGFIGEKKENGDFYYYEGGSLSKVRRSDGKVLLFDSFTENSSTKTQVDHYAQEGALIKTYIYDAAGKLESISFEDGSNFIYSNNLGDLETDQRQELTFLEDVFLQSQDSVSSKKTLLEQKDSRIKPR